MRQRRRKSRQQYSPYKLYGSVVIGGVSVIIGVLVGGGMSMLWAYILAVSSVAFVLFGFDKAIAHSGFIRVPERIFYILAFIGASPALLLGQKLFHHKTMKASFQVVFLVIVAMQIALLAYLLLDGSATITSVEHSWF